MLRSSSSVLVRLFLKVQNPSCSLRTLLEAVNILERHSATSHVVWTIAIAIACIHTVSQGSPCIQLLHFA